MLTLMLTSVLRHKWSWFEYKLARYKWT